MYSNDSVTSVHDFLKTTPEGALKKMLVSGEFTEGHLRLILKVAKNSQPADFVAAFTSETLPQIFKLSPAETKAKDNFWPVCKKKLEQMGLISKEKAA